MTLTHATCVAIGDIGVLIRGPSGAGKSDLALRLIDRGAVLVSDDYCHLSVEEGALTARTPEAIAGKIEVRGHGIVDGAHRPSVQIGLVVDLAPTDDIPRLPERQTCTVEGMMIAHVIIDPDTPSAAAKIRVIMRTLAVEHDAGTGGQ
ncbi:MAG: hypothetical protein GKS03_04240 [Alphaproteobacteria bacterium]|nr:hypothetical protein [Alphaproteobacteria bacterium]